MALQIKIQEMKKSGEPDKWYGKAVKRQDVTLEHIAGKKLSRRAMYTVC